MISLPECIVLIAVLICLYFHYKNNGCQYSKKEIGVKVSVVSRKKNTVQNHNMKTGMKYFENVAKFKHLRRSLRNGI
jgi:hypothetical protein